MSPMMTYAKKVPVMVESKIIDREMGMVTKGELAKATVKWRQANFGAVKSELLKVPHKCAGEMGVLWRGHHLLQPLTPLCLRNSALTMSRGTSIPHRGLPFLCLGL